jgi:ribosome-associated toxin RatA of RatAB toxin-antitoxin module
MSELIFSLSSPILKEKLFNYIIDFEYYKNYFPNQISQILITEKTQYEIHTTEEIVFSSIVKNIIHQKSIHRLNPYENITTEIVEGPAKGSTILITLSTVNSETEVTFNAELKLSLKAKFLGPLIKKLYKRYLTSLMYKINNRYTEK